MAEPFLLTMAKIAQDTYSGLDVPLPAGWTRTDMIERNNFLARAYKPPRGRMAVIAYRGSANWRDFVIADAGAIGIGINAFGLELNSAIDFTAKIKTLYPDSWLVGHSLGGAYVQLLAAICELPGITFNAPGALAMLNQMSSRPIVALAGGLGSGALSVLSLGISDYFNKAAAALEDTAFQSVLNYRGNMDPVSLVGTHVGSPIQDIMLVNQSPHPHSMAPIIATLEGRAALSQPRGGALRGWSG